MKRRRTSWKHLCGVALLAISFCAAAAWITFDTLFSPRAHTGEAVRIEEYCGRELGMLSFPPYLEVHTEYRYDAGVRAGIVLSQTPVGGSQRKLTRENPTVSLTLVVSLGKESAIVPSVVGLDAREAESSLRQCGFAVEVRHTASAYPEGRVLGVEPTVGEQLPVGSKVTLLVSRGVPPESVSVPDVRGLSREDALVTLWLSQLSVGEVIEEPSLTEEGTVLRQSHQPGTLVLAGTKVTLYVAASVWD